jgi:hypothetical protein
LKFGFGFERDQLNEIDLTADYQGIFKFGSIAAFLTNQSSGFTGAFPKLVAPRGMRQSIVGAYIQDDWRVRPNLTLNLGVRYEMSTVPSEAHGKLATLYSITDALPHCAIPNPGCVATGPYFLNPTLRNFEPRVGFSWDPFKNGKTAVRGGFGMFDVLPMLYTTITMVGRGAPFYEIGGTQNKSKLNGKFPSGLVPDTDLSGKNIEYERVEHQPRRNYVMQWNLNVQRELAPNLTMVVGYAGSHGVHQGLRVDDANIVAPPDVTLTSAGYLWPVVPFMDANDPSLPSPGPGTLINPDAGAIRQITWPGDSFYDALEIGVVKKMSHGLQVQGSYTWGKSIDNNSGVTNGDTFANAFSSVHWFDLRLSRAVSDYNIPRVLAINGSWHVPTSKSASGAVAFIANGWELGTIFKVNDGVPFTPTFGSGGDPLLQNSTDAWDFPNRVTSPDCATLINPRSTTNYLKIPCFAIPTAPASFFTGPTPVCSSDTRFGENAIGAPPQCFNLRGNEGRNVVYGPGLTNLDFSVFKNNSIRRISENFNVQFRVEVFNILNHANFSPPTVSKLDVFDENGDLTGTAGLLNGTTTDSRQIQFALKFTW